jgi:autoinducer 2-degrading protein
MHFEASRTEEFLEMFSEVREKIRGFEGCEHLELYRDQSHSNVYFTYSIWDSAEHLDKYRYSELFKTTWTKTKAMFAQKAEAWSLERVRF